MVLRMMLVSLVASLGFELPSGRDATAWVQSGRNWVDARIGDFAEFRAAGERAFVGITEADGPGELAKPAISDPAPTLKASADLAFEAVAETMVADFAADRLAQREIVAAPVVVSVAAIPETVEPTPTALPSGEEFVASVESAPDAVAASPEIVADGGEACATAERLSSAVRLTRQAVQAWAELIQGCDAEADSAR